MDSTNRPATPPSPPVGAPVPASPPEAAAPRFYALSESHALGEATCREAGLELASVEERVFEDAEFKLRPLESVRDRRAFVLQSLAPGETDSVSDRFLRLLFLLSVLRDAGAVERIAILPYLAFARKERRTQLHDPVYTRYVAELLEASGVSRVVGLDVHDPAALDNAFRIPVDHLSALPMMADHLARRLGTAQLVVVSPDIGGIKRAQLFQELMQGRTGQPVDLVFVEKRRVAGVASTGRLAGEVRERHAVIVDDLCATGGTLIRAAERCLAAGATAIHVAVTHAPLASGLEAVIAADFITDIVITDSTGVSDRPAFSTARKLTTLPLGPLLGQVVRRMVTGRTIAPLLSRWPVAPDE